MSRFGQRTRLTGTSEANSINKWFGGGFTTFGNPDYLFKSAYSSNSSIQSWPWSDATGFGTQLSSPGTEQYSKFAVWAPNSKTVGVSAYGTPFGNATKFWEFNPTLGTYGSAYGTSPSGVTSANGMAYNPLGTDIAIAHTPSPWLSIYPWTDATGFGTKYANMATVPSTNGGTQVDFNPTGTAVGWVGGTSAHMKAWPWTSGTGFGTGYSDPATMPSSGGDIRYSPDGTDIFVISGSSPYALAYPWSSGFGTKYADPATLPSAAPKGVSVSKTGGAVIYNSAGGAVLDAYPWVSHAWGTRFTNPTLTGVSRSYSADFSGAGGAFVLGFGITISPYIKGFAWSDSTGFGSAYSNPATLPVDDPEAIAFNNHSY